MAYAVYEGTKDVVCPEEPTEETPDQQQHPDDDEDDDDMFSMYLV